MPKQNQRRDPTTLWSLYLLGVLYWLVVRLLRRPIAVADALLPLLLMMMMAPSSSSVAFLVRFHDGFHDGLLSTAASIDVVT